MSVEGQRIAALEGQRVAALERRIAGLERADAALVDAAYLVAHDLAEPARSVGGFAQLLERRWAGRLEPEDEELLAQLTAAARRMQELVGALADFVAARRATLRPERVEVTALVRGVVERRSALLDELGGSVAVGELPAVEGDPSLLADLFARLLDNALKFRGDAPPRVEVSGGQGEDGEAVYEVADRGVGIDADDREQLLRLFRRGAGAGDYAGTGAGLAICEAIAARHGGRLELAAREGGGTVARVALRGTDASHGPTVT